MSEPRDGWDAEERDAIKGLEDELAGIRARHAGDPSIDLLRAADADALPPELQREVAAHLQSSAWSRALVDGLREAGENDQLDPDVEQRILERVTREAGASVPAPRRWSVGVAIGGLAIAATLLIAVMVSREDREPQPPPVEALTATQPPAPVEPPSISYAKPAVKLSPSALTFRGGSADNPFLRDLAPAFEAYRADDFSKAVEAFNALAAKYPDAIEILFYQGVSRLLAGDAAGAVAPLSAADRLAVPAFADDVKWSLSVAMHRSGDASARARFAELCAGSSEHAAGACTAVTLIDSARQR